MTVQKYRLGSALRPFSFSVALVVCLTGILLAFRDNYGDLVLASVVLGAGLLLQAGVNLINDYADLTPQFRQTYPQSSQLILRNFRLGLGCFSRQYWWDLPDQPIRFAIATTRYFRTRWGAGLYP